MAVDFKINLAKDLTSTPEERARFYNGMLVYLVVCAALMVLVAYLASVNMQQFLANRQERIQLLRTVSSVSDIDQSAFRNPGKVYADLETHAMTIADLKKALGQRVLLLPIMHNLFIDLPEGVSLQSLSANKSKLDFGLVMPPPSDSAGDPVKQLRSAWEENEELMKRVSTIRPVTGERRVMGTTSVFYVQFECLLNK
ncbi:hypothetical protein PDESU_06138 [Pontiella desulfatans]|uniref:Uncharacterized protein n=1 Tax=Pontiella desulfatans TaxID=2750659 RepID=A0A6C2UDP7_PONDE|nr:hypothetical protein [Pontiella desulfatans]VGO17541.1 hypothetical protein PDESU_06138 [Pontiella desulfatans]